MHANRRPVACLSSPMLVSQRSFICMQIFFPVFWLWSLFYFLSKWFWMQGCHQLIKKSFRASDKVSQAFALGFHPVKIVYRIISENSLLWLLLQEPRRQRYLRKIICARIIRLTKIRQNSQRRVRWTKSQKCKNWLSRGPHLGMRPSGWIPCSRQ